MVCWKLKSNWLDWHINEQYGFQNEHRGKFVFILKSICSNIWCWCLAVFYNRINRLCLFLKIPDSYSVFCCGVNWVDRAQYFNDENHSKNQIPGFRYHTCKHDGAPTINAWSGSNGFMVSVFDSLLDPSISGYTWSRHNQHAVKLENLCLHFVNNRQFRFICIFLFSIIFNLGSNRKIKYIHQYKKHIQRNNGARNCFRR